MKRHAFEPGGPRGRCARCGAGRREHPEKPARKPKATPRKAPRKVAPKRRSSAAATRVSAAVRLTRNSGAPKPRKPGGKAKAKPAAKPAKKPAPRPQKRPKRPAAATPSPARRKAASARPRAKGAKGRATPTKARGARAAQLAAEARKAERARKRVAAERKAKREAKRRSEAAALGWETRRKNKRRRELAAEKAAATRAKLPTAKPADVDQLIKEGAKPLTPTDAEVAIQLATEQAREVARRNPRRPGETERQYRARLAAHLRIANTITGPRTKWTLYERLAKEVERLVRRGASLRQLAAREGMTERQLMQIFYTGAPY